MNQNLSVLIGKSFNWHSNNDGNLICQDMFKIVSVSKDRRTYKRLYQNGDIETFSVRSLMKQLKKGVYVNSSLSNQDIIDLTNKVPTLLSSIKEQALNALKIKLF